MKASAYPRRSGVVHRSVRARAPGTHRREAVAALLSRPGRHLARAGLGLVVAGIAVASIGLSSRAWPSLMFAGFALIVIAAFAGAAHSRR